MSQLLSEKLAQHIAKQLSDKLKSRVGTSLFTTEDQINIITDHCKNGLRQVMLFEAEASFLPQNLAMDAHFFEVIDQSIPAIVGDIIQENKLLAPVTSGLAGLYYGHTKYNTTSPLAVGAAFVSAFWKSSATSSNKAKTETPAYVANTEAITTRMLARVVHIALIKRMNYDQLSALAEELYTYKGEEHVPSGKLLNIEGYPYSNTNPATLQLRQEQTTRWQGVTGKPFGPTATWREVVLAVRARGAEMQAAAKADGQVFDNFFFKGALFHIMGNPIPSHGLDLVEAGIERYNQSREKNRDNASNSWDSRSELDKLNYHDDDDCTYRK